MDEEQKAKHQEFKGKRQAHYSNEAALALKRAREMPDEEEEEEAEEAGGVGGMEGITLNGS